MKTTYFLLLLAGITLVSCTPEDPPAPKTVTFQGNTYEFSLNYQSSNNVNVPGNIQVYYSNLLSTSTGTLPFLGIGYGFNTFADSSLENFNGFFTTGSKPYQTPGNLNGAFVNFSTATDTYSSNMASQNGSTFHFTSLHFHDGNPDYMDYSADFSCKVYDWTDTTIFYPISGSVNGKFVAAY